VTVVTEKEPSPEPSEPADDRPQRARRGLVAGPAVLTALSILLALAVGAVLIIVSNPEVQEKASYFFTRPQDTLGAAWTAVSEAYVALFQASVINVEGSSLGQVFRPLTETLVTATPLIAAGLSVALAFRAGLFNIGAEGQIIAASIAAAYVGFTWDLPIVIHLVVAIAAGMAAGAVWGGIAGLLKARTGAHEVITTIMLNYVARFLVVYLLGLKAFQREGRTDPISPVVAPAAELPLLLGAGFRLHLGFVLALLAAAFVWWLLARSTIGFRFRAVGANPNAARTAGISVERSYTGVMLVAGALAGLAGVSQVLGTSGYLTAGVSGGIGFDAITVALLGRGSPVGTVLAGLLFGGLRAGGIGMQASTGTSVDLVLILQALIVLFIAAPPLVRAVFRIRTKGNVGVGQVSKGWNA